MKKILLLIITLTTVILSTNAQNWTQLGNTIESTESSTSFATNNATNSAGTRYIQGAYQEDSNGVTDAGMASVYAYNAGIWTQLGSSLVGTDELDNYGYSVDINSIGDIIAIGALQHVSYGPTVYDTGYVEVLQYDGTDWIQLGGRINGNSSSNGFGVAISLNSDGTTIAITAPYNDDNASNTGLLQIFSFDGTNWVQKGQNIYGLGSNDTFGTSIDLSDDGQRLIVGCSKNYDYGYVQVWDFDGTNWILQTTFNASQSYDGIGRKVRINNAGDVVSIGHSSYDGQVTNGGVINTYKFDGTDWVLLGNPIYGEENMTFGNKFDIDSLGNTIIIGSKGYNNYKGKIQVFEFDGTDWFMVGDTIKGTQEHEQLGTSVSISNDASVIIEGQSPTTSSSITGKIKSYIFTCNSSSYTEIRECASYTFNSVTYNESIVLQDTVPNYLGCDSIITTNIIIDTVSTDFEIYGNMLIAVQQQADIIEWINCETNDHTYISNPSSISPTVSNQSEYALIVTNGVCKDTSDCYFVCFSTDTVITDTVCLEYDFNGTILTETGVYYDTIANISGCDSLMTLDLIIKNIDLSVNQISDTLISNQVNAEYQWIDCNTSTYISGETDSLFIPENSGNYAVIITYNTCTDTSICNSITITDISENLNNFGIHIYPNPTHNKLIISNSQLLINNAEILDITGKTVKKFTVNSKIVYVDISNLRNGVYFLKLQGVNISKTLKLIKK